VSAETHRSFACFGGAVAVHIRGAGPNGGEEDADRCHELLLGAHRGLSRFEPDSELSRLNRDRREAVPASALLMALAAAAGEAGEKSGGLVDATLLGEIERAGYRESLAGPRPAASVLTLAEALAIAPPRRAAGPSPAGGWRHVSIDETTGCVVRPPGLGLDGGGIAKGLLADWIAAELAAEPAFAVDCCGDVRVGGSAGLDRRLLVEDPFGGPPLHELSVREGAAATSGIGRRCWRRADGRPAHHLLDPATGEPAFTGLVQVTALAPTALEAEVLAKVALLTGSGDAGRWLPHGGVLVADDGSAEVVAAATHALRPGPVAKATA